MTTINQINRALSCTEGVFNFLGKLPLISMGSGSVRALGGVVEIGVGATALIILTLSQKITPSTNPSEHQKRVYNAFYAKTYIHHGAGNIGRGFAEFVPFSFLVMTLILKKYSTEQNGRIMNYKLYSPPQASIEDSEFWAEQPKTGRATLTTSEREGNLEVFKERIEPFLNEDENEPVYLEIENYTDSQLYWLEETFEKFEKIRGVQLQTHLQTCLQATMVPSNTLLIDPDTNVKWHFQAQNLREIYLEINHSLLRKHGVSDPAFFLVLKRFLASSEKTFITNGVEKHFKDLIVHAKGDDPKDVLIIRFTAF